jgi:iron-sulfur cluster repair protein YtfE (RIC family)
MEKESVNHPSHYGGKDNTYEAIKVIEAWDLDFCLGNVIKYLSRAGKKSDKKVEDLEKALWYLSREIENLKKKNKQDPQDNRYQITTL